ncbi:GNAT family N-acetyltransferase [Nocardioides euryhalodurans]|uniref:GNAT family N-acetyltransferase n=1 Tax=Nocardioides euryhalodurans TaxID=2518370 RepID=A0A4P7GQ17_9ACTN|nr:GNAT family N-acetyltransferase [Nocardioides euryhalodurans]QBR93921.1 GNAT family N-acetyltransferase [Nocardioides euryhalodurans]
MTTSDVRVDRATDDERYLATDEVVWFDEPGSLPAADELAGVPADQRFAAEVPDADPATYAGIYGVRPLQLAVPGGEGARLVPCAGLTWVGVHPDQRRRGVLTAMLRHHVEQTHREGVAISALHASEAAIYGRHGWGVASLTFAVSLGRGTELKAPGLDEEAAALRTRMAGLADPGIAERLRECELRVAVGEPGMVVGELGFFEAIVIHQREPRATRDKEPMRFLFAQRDGVDVGHAAFRREHKWEQGRPGGKLEVFAVVGAPATRLALLRRLVDFDLMASVKVPEVGVDDPLWQWIGPRSASDVETTDNLWLRIVDLPAALPLRSYVGDCDVVVEVDDPAAPWQAGRWRIVTRGGEGSATRTDADADASLPVAALGSAYLGGTNLVAMLRAGVLSEHRPGAIGELWRAFRTDLAPTPASGF